MTLSSECEANDWAVERKNNLLPHGVDMETWNHGTEGQREMSALVTCHVWHMPIPHEWVSMSWKLQPEFSRTFCPSRMCALPFRTLREARSWPEEAGHSRWPRVLQQWAPVGYSPIGIKEDFLCRCQAWQQLTNKTGGLHCTIRTCWNWRQCISMLHLQQLDELNTWRLCWYGKFEHDSNWNSSEVVALSGQRTTGSNPHPSSRKLRISHDLPSHNLKEKVSFSSTHFILLPHLHRVERSEKVCNYQPKTVFAILEMVLPGLWSAVSIRFQFGHTVMFSQVKDSLITSFR